MPVDGNTDLRQFYEGGCYAATKPPRLMRSDNFMYGQILKQMRPYLRPGAKVLDLGCHTGGLSLYMARRGCEVLGLDLARNAVAMAAQGAEAYGFGNASFQAMDFITEWEQPDAFDFVLCSCVIEHIPDDAQFVRKIAMALKPGGKLLMMAPSVHSTTHKMSRRAPHLFHNDEDVGHLHRYTTKSLAEMMQQAGLQVKRMAFLDGPLRDWSIICKPLSKSLRLWRQRGIRVLFNGLDSLLARFIVASLVAVHAEKPRTRGMS